MVKFDLTENDFNLMMSQEFYQNIGEFKKIAKIFGEYSLNQAIRKTCQTMSSRLTKQTLVLFSPFNVKEFNLAPSLLNYPTEINIKHLLGDDKILAIKTISEALKDNYYIQKVEVGDEIDEISANDYQNILANISRNHQIKKTVAENFMPIYAARYQQGNVFFNLPKPVAKVLLKNLLPQDLSDERVMNTIKNADKHLPKQYKR